MGFSTPNAQSFAEVVLGSKRSFGLDRKFRVDVEIFQADNSEAGGQIFVVGDQALDCDLLNHFIHARLVVMSDFVEHVPEGPLQPQGRGLSVDAKTAFFGNKFVNLFRRTGIEHIRGFMKFYRESPAN